MSIIDTLPDPAHKIIPAWAELLTALEPGLVKGIYLTGSIALADFHSSKSDIDFLVLCSQLPAGVTLAQLKLIHQRIRKQYRRPGLSGCYLASHSLLCADPANIHVLSYDNGNWREGNLEMAPVSLSELKSTAITVAGPNAESIVHHVTAEQLRIFLHENINSYWTKWIARHSNFFCRKVLLWLFPKMTEWSVLGVARQLHTLRTGTIVSKSEAGRYALLYLPEKYHPIIREALEIRGDDRSFAVVHSYVLMPSTMRLKKTVECVNYMIAEFNRQYVLLKN